MELFFGYLLPMILLIGGLIIFKRFFVKCIKTPTYYYGREVIREPIKFALYNYIWYIGGAIIPFFNWIILILLCSKLLIEDYFSSYSWSDRDYYYEIPDETINKWIDCIAEKLEKLFNKKWFMLICTPFVYIYKIMNKKL